MSKVGSVPKSQLYSKSFWSLDTSSHEILELQNSKSTKTLNNLSTFYREFSSLEKEYSRKLNSLVYKLNLSKYESSNSTLIESMDTFHTQCLKITESHSLQANRIEDSILPPLTELISTRKAKEKVLESKISMAWKELVSLKEKSESKSLKYEKKWNELNSMKAGTLTMNRRELEIFDERTDVLKKKIYLIREENWELVNKFNEKLNDWQQLWWDSCEEWQNMEEERIRFLKNNIWEFANILSLYCVETDQFAEIIRTSLQELSATKDISTFVSKNTTGDFIFAPLQFVDFVKNENRPLHVETQVKFDINNLPNLKSKFENNTDPSSSSPKMKKNPPPESPEIVVDNADDTYSFISKSKETLKELQEQTQKELVDLRINTSLSSHIDDNKSVSEPSTFKVASDYSAPTAQTSFASLLENVSCEELTNPIAKYKQQQNELNSSSNQNNYQLSSINNKKEDQIHNPLKNAFSTLKDDTNLRSSMMETKSKSNKRNTFASYVKNAFSEPATFDDNKFDFGHFLNNRNKTKNEEDVGNINENKKNSDIESRIQRNSLVLNKTKSSISKARNISDNMKKSKSSSNVKSNHFSINDLPSKSCGGFDVIAYTKAKYDYVPQMESELGLKKKDTVLVLHKQTDGWWFAENLNSGDSGLAPGNYLVEIEKV